MKYHIKKFLRSFFRNYSSDSQTELGEPSSVLKGNGSSGLRRPSGVATQLKAEYVKTIISCLYMFLVTWITAIVMVFVHDRVPDRVNALLNLIFAVVLSFC